ncbi:MAG: type pilus assembly protein PilN [Thermosediminibacterales bacterium]|nr:type pilus assembly protein PilN [Thermosediminibacterales bacterium]
MKEINLLPDDYIKKRSNRFKTGIKIISFIMIIGLLTFSFYYIIHLYQQLESKTVMVNKIYNEELGPLLKEKQELQKNSMDIQQKYELFLKLSKEKILWSEILLEIAEIIPKDVQIKNVFFDKDKNMVISGEAFSNISIAEFIVNLNKSSYFKDVNLNYILNEKNDIGVKNNIMRFELTFSLEEKGEKPHE